MALGNGQQPYFPLDSLQQVELLWHWDSASGHWTAVFIVSCEGIFAMGWVLVTVRQREWARSQEVPWGQQCTLSPQQEAWGMGQQPQEPSSIVQHVEELGQWNWLLGHRMSSEGLVSGLRRQDHPSALQWKPCGQQWRPSLHDTASGNGQQLEVSLVVRMQEWPGGHWALVLQGTPRCWLSALGHLSGTGLQQL